MRETFLHNLWRTRRFDPRRLITTTFQPLEIIDPGEYNSHSGPDFFNARIRIGDTVWAGNVEIHIRASDWAQHGHHEDPAYNNVILHVVYLEDKALYLPSGERLQTLELRDRIPRQLFLNFIKLETSADLIPCQAFFHQVSSLVRNNWYDRLLVERLEQKTAELSGRLEQHKNDWDAVFYEFLATGFGLKVNVQPFDMLARSLPLQILYRHRDQLLQLEALLFGQAGFLKKPVEEVYPKALAKEYRHLAHKYGLSPMGVSNWKFLRMRPAGFPTLRIAQLAALLHHTEHLFRQTLDANGPADLEALFRVEPGDYWRTHYRFGKESPAIAKVPGRDFVETLIVNVLLPFMFFYGKKNDQPALQEKALAFFEELPPEHNQVLEIWEKIGVRPGNAAISQALLQLKTRYCAEKRCYECAIGHQILNGMFEDKSAPKAGRAQPK